MPGTDIPGMPGIMGIMPIDGMPIDGMPAHRASDSFESMPDTALVPVRTQRHHQLGARRLVLVRILP